MASTTISELLAEYTAATSYTDALWTDLTEEEVAWRPNPNSSAIGWHLGHQAAVAHFMIRNLTSAEPSPDPDLDMLMDSATSEPDRGDLPGIERLAAYRHAVADRVRYNITKIESGNVGAPTQLAVIAKTLLVAIVNHEYQHSKWIGEVRSEQFNKSLPPDPTSELLTSHDNYLVLEPALGAKIDELEGTTAAAPGFEVTENADELRFELLRDGELVGFASYDDRDGNVVVPHVETFPQHRGQGFAAKLMDGLLETIRADGRTITPLCPFAAQHIRDNPAHHDLVAQR